MARSAAMIGIATGIVALTAVAALAVGNPAHDDGDKGDHPTGLRHPRGQEQAEWARDHHGPPPWSHGRGHDKAHGPDQADKGDHKDKADKAEKHGKQKDKQKDEDEERSS